MRSWSLAVVVALSGGGACSDPPDVVTFASREGIAAGFETCDCLYYDGTDGAEPQFQISCQGDGELGDVTVFLDSRDLGTDHRTLLLVTPANQSRSYSGEGTGRVGTLGELRDGDPNVHQQVRTIEGMDLAWASQSTCSVGSPCTPPYDLAAGALHGGTGGCEDYYATVNGHARRAR